MWIELHVGPVNDPRPVTINTAKIQDFQPIPGGMTEIFFSQKDSYPVMESYERVKSLLGINSRRHDNTGEKLRQREEFFRKGNECFVK